MNAIVQSTESQTAIMERVLLAGDLSKLSATDRLFYYTRVCESVGLNPLTRPFDYLQLNGKLTLYAKRDATDQLRKIHNVSITISDRQTIEGVYVVTARAKDKTAREDESTGAVTITGLKGDALANALMKAETKAKRRVTLSICGLGMLDETEIETIPLAVRSGEQGDLIPCGKHKGKKWADITDDYLDWCVSSDKVPGDLKNGCEVEIERRKQARSGISANPRGDLSDVDFELRDKRVSEITDLIAEYGSDEQKMGEKMREYVREYLQPFPELYIAVNDKLAADKIISKANLKKLLSMTLEGTRDHG